MTIQSANTPSLYERSFSGLNNLYGNDAISIFAQSHICVIGIGGVGSWAAESLARTGIGQITLIDLDNISQSNINRQIHALNDTVGMSKVDAMKTRILSINPNCVVNVIEDFIEPENVDKYISTKMDFVIDCIDSVKSKAAVVHFCKRNKIRLVTTGGAGGKNDPSQIDVCDLNQTYHDPLLSSLRKALKNNHKITPNKRNRYDVMAIFSKQQSVYLDKETGSVNQKKPKTNTPHGLNCHHGMGSLMAMTSCMGMIASSVVINKLIDLAKINK